MRVVGSRPCLAAAIAAVTLLVVGCGTPDSMFATVPTAPTNTGPAIPTPAPAILTVTFEPRAVNGGGTATGLVSLTVPAAAGGLPIQLASGDAAVGVPSSVTVPAGSDRVQFNVTSQFVAKDTQAPVRATAGGRTVTGTLPVYADLPNYFAWFSDQGDWVGGGEFGRLTIDTSTITVTGNDTLVRINFNGGGEFWSAEFTPPRNGRLAVGTYPNAQRSAFRDATSPGLDVSGRSRGCNTVSGRFTVLEADLTSTSVRRFRATFEQHCDGRSAALVGDIRVIR